MPAYLLFQAKKIECQAIYTYIICCSTKHVANYAVPLRRLFCEGTAAQPTPYPHICCSTKHASDTRNMRVGSGWWAAPCSPARRNGNGVCVCAPRARHRPPRAEYFAWTRQRRGYPDPSHLAVLRVTDAVAERLP